MSKSKFIFSKSEEILMPKEGLVGCFGFNGPLRQYFSLYRAFSQKEGESGEKGQMRVKMSKQPSSAPTASAVGPIRTYCKCSRPLSYCNPNCRTPRHWKLTLHHRTTRPPPPKEEIIFGLLSNNVLYCGSKTVS